MEWETVIGLEIHAQLATKSKIFSGAATAYGAEANAQACAVDLGLPGVLPVINEDVVKMAIKFGLAIEADIPDYSVFARKNYFYPDLPKGYQISQYELPIVGNGRIDIQLEDGTLKTIGITRAHLEEDAGKSVHDGFTNLTGIDLNRAGTPLIEIVSEPDMRSAQEAVTYMRKIHSIVRYLEICDGNMQEGSFRCDANVSIRPKGETELGTRTELKNLNSFRFIEQAINYEIERQIEVIESGGKVVQETRLYDPNKNETRSMRSKEEANDYRYFPDPDLLPVHIEKEIIEKIKKQLPELPDAKRKRFINDYGLSDYDSTNLTVSRELADYFEATVKSTNGEAKLSANWIMGELSAALNKQNKVITESPVTAEMLGGMINRIKDNTISTKIAKEVFEAMWNGEGNADDIIEKKSLKQVTDTGAIEKLVDEVIADSPAQVEKYQQAPEEKRGKLIGYFVGQVMKKSQGKANPQQVNELLKENLVVIPAHCPTCGAVFRSRILSISGNVKNLTLSGNTETCPFCGSIANTAEGIFDIVNDIITVITAPDITKEMLAAFDAIVKKAYQEKTDPEDLAKQAEEIDPTLGKLVRSASSNKPYYLTGLLLLILTIKSCNFNINLDVNKLIDQLKDVAPSYITTKIVDDKEGKS